MDENTTLIDVENPEELEPKDRARLILDFFHRTMMHHALWYAEVKHQLGEERGLELLQKAAEKSFAIQLNHLSQLLGFEMVDGIPEPLLNLSEDTQKELLERAAKNWLVGDGVWFQAF